MEVTVKQKYGNYYKQQKLNPKTGNPTNTSHSLYGKHLPSDRRANLRQRALDNSRESYTHQLKKCHLVHMQTGRPVNFTSISEACRFLEIPPVGVTRTMMVRNGKHDCWYFYHGEFNEHIVIEENQA